MDKDLIYNRGTLPILYTCDTVVVGGSFGGVAAALELAKTGRKVALVEPRTYLGREITATLRPWIRVSPETDPASLPELISACIEASGTSGAAGEFPLHMDAVKTCLEDLLLAAGVKLIYASLPVGLCTAEGKLQGVVIGNKSGRQVLVCQALLDTSETALMARLAGAEFEAEPDGPLRFSRTLEFDRVSPLDEMVLPVPQHLGLVGDRVALHLGYRGQGHVLVEFELALPSRGSNALELTRRETVARRKTTKLVEYLLFQVSTFENAYLASSSYELYGPHTTRMAGPTPRWGQPLESVAVEVGQTPQAVVSEFAGLVAGLWCLNEAARVDDRSQALIRDPVEASRLGTALAQAIHGHWEIASAANQAMSQTEVSAGVSPRPVKPDRPDLQVKEQEWPQRGCHYELFPVTPAPVPVLRAADVVVVGAGSSGAVAGIIAGQEGMRTVLVDMNPGLGGTGTYGGIHTYWFGRRIGFVDQLMGWLDTMHDRLRLPRPQGVLATWNIEARTGALMEQAEDVGVEMLLNALVIGAVVEGGAVRGVVVATRVGPVALLSEVTIDATGDGDVAAFAGAEYVYGSDRDHSVMYAYMPQIIKPGHPRNVKTSMLDVSNVEDYTRMILAERRRGQKGDHDHGVYIAPRESRHIKGDIVLTLTDQLVRRCWPDVVHIAFGNHDIKGESNSDWVRMGLQPPNLEIEIPYRALLPRGLENILVVGKAYSATHDALAAPRMQSDLENLGGVAALAAAMAVRSGKSPRDIDIQGLQARLVEVGALPKQVLTRTLVPLAYTDEELESLIDSLDAERPLHTYSEMEIGQRYDGRVSLVDVMCAGPQVVPMLENALRRAEGRRQVLLAQALATLGSKAGVSVLASAIQNQLEGDRLPGREDKVRFVGYPPDQGAGPDVAHLLYSLGMARDRRVLPTWQRVVDLLASATDEDVFDQHRSLYYYVTALCYGAERLGDPAAIPILEKLHSYPLFRSRACVSGFQSDFLKERLAYLELLIGRALARCGGPDGFVILINYLNDVRAILAEHAYTELVAITRQDFGKDMAAWGQWLESEGEDLKPAPWLSPSDPMVAWGEVILIPALERKPEE